MKVQVMIKALLTVVASLALLGQCEGQVSNKQLLGKWKCVTTGEDETEPVFGTGDEGCPYRIEFFKDGEAIEYAEGQKYEYTYSVTDKNVLELGDKYYKILELNKERLVLEETRLQNPESLLFKEKRVYVREKE